ncbi:NUT family member 2G-like [Trichechus manatus latirostris]|uniref:NUT family member 2G-like n=1 Tax=Trichechus manatus latirostris TaxID=127582 RepID=A0A2Y9FZL1_TRIMA|nr:NUT family member 2G-like [Trichechus manatus latirostris]
MNPDASIPPFTELPFPPTTPEPLHRTPWQQYSLPLMTSSCPPGVPLGLSVIPRTLLLPGVGDSGPTGARPGKVIVQESLDSTQSRPLLDDSSCNPKSVYENYQHWQSFKSLARRHHPHSPDTEALSCFLIPVLRSLARLKPTMTLEAGLWRSVQEWERKSNFDRMIFYEMAGKFMEFEAEEELQIQKLQQRNVSVCLPPPSPWNLDPQRPSSTVVGQHSATVEPDGTYQEEENEQQQEENGTYPDLGLLSYIDKLCSQEAFITKVEAVIHPRFLEMLLSPESQVDPVSLTQELEKEEGLTLTQVNQRRKGES